MKTSKLHCLSALLVLMGGVATAQPTAYFEAIDLDAKWGSQLRSSTAVSYVDLSAFSLSMNAVLRTHSDLINTAPASVSKAINESDALILKGHLHGKAASWVRLSRVEGLWSGAVWDGHELYLIDGTSSLSAHGFVGLPARANTVIFRQSEARWPAVRDLVIDPTKKVGSISSALDLGKLDLALSTNPDIAKGGSSLRLDMTIVADTEFVSLNSGNPAAAVMARINVVDGVYAGQTGVSIRVEHLELLAENGTLTATDSHTLLGEFASYMRSSDLPQPGLTHLFSGKNFDSNIVGVAWLGVLCSQSYGYGINEFRGSGSSGSMILAHEMGHNFGAPHDGSGACADETFRGIMNPSINGTDQFSNCSLTQMADDVSRASCLEVIDFVYSNGFE